MTLFFVALVMFAMPQLILKAIPLQDAFEFDEDSDKTEGFYGSDLINSILDQYQQVLDGDDPAYYHDHEHSTLIAFTNLFFLAATFFTNITMFNMLIAIMGDKFDHLTDNKQLNATRTKLRLLADYASNLRIPPTEAELREHFLYVVEAEKDEEERSEEWIGTVVKIE